MHFDALLSPTNKGEIVIQDVFFISINVILNPKQITLPILLLTLTNTCLNSLRPSDAYMRR